MLGQQSTFRRATCSFDCNMFVIYEIKIIIYLHSYLLIHLDLFIDSFRFIFYVNSCVVCLHMAHKLADDCFSGIVLVASLFNRFTHRSYSIRDGRHFNLVIQLLKQAASADNRFDMSSNTFPNVSEAGPIITAGSDLLIHAHSDNRFYVAAAESDTS